MQYLALIIEYATSQINGLLILTRLYLVACLSDTPLI